MRMCLTALDSQTRPKLSRPPSLPRSNTIDERSRIALPHCPRGKIWSHRTVLIAFISFPHGFFLLFFFFQFSHVRMIFRLRSTSTKYVGMEIPKIKTTALRNGDIFTNIYYNMLYGGRHLS